MPLHQLQNWPPRIDDAYRTPGRVFVVGVERYSQSVVNGRDYIERCRQSFFDTASVLFTGADDTAALNSSTGKHDGEAIRPMITS